MGILIRIVLVAAGAVTAWFLAPEATNFGVVQGMIGLGLMAALLVILAVWWRR